MHDNYSYTGPMGELTQSIILFHGLVIVLIVGAWVQDALNRIHNYTFRSCASRNLFKVKESVITSW